MVVFALQPFWFSFWALAKGSWDILSANGPCQRALGQFLVHLVGLAKGLLEKQLALHMGSWALEKGSWRGRGLETKKVCVCPLSCISGPLWPKLW